MAVTWKRFSPEKALQSQSAVLSVYREAFAGPPYFETEQAVQRFAASWPTKVACPGFRFVGAFDPHAGMVGMALGWKADSNGKWAELVRTALGEEAEAWLADCFQFAELAVKPDARGLGLGQILTAALFRAVTERTALLLTLDEKTAARKLYDRDGWQVLAPSIPRGDRNFLLMGKRLRA